MGLEPRTFYHKFVSHLHHCFSNANPLHVLPSLSLSGRLLQIPLSFLTVQPSRSSFVFPTFTFPVLLVSHCSVHQVFLSHFVQTTHLQVPLDPPKSFFTPLLYLKMTQHFLTGIVTLFLTSSSSVVPFLSSSFYPRPPLYFAVTDLL